ncbi:MAG: preprotein translocase subunit SecA [Candidatus Doudnabacteria bacterium Gr01-1014_77]|uniref:Protein translocase subunit SecA n=1 Tax=Candidatus Doudnabacteria bacterium Gr01-1014_77 TaxID=2017133 RepID=A0A554JC15_9BACT|nr:MAG: preprotein translocase subunit SecA [Candidatus Doudnabacteria bacterium Gr01-1014_77]
MSFLEKIFGGNQRVVSKLQGVVDKINAFEDRFKDLTDDQIKEQVQAWKSQLSNENEPKDYEEQKKILEQILPDVFALTREAAKRTIGQRHYDVQLIGGITLHRGQIAEMKTGEGKTLTATLPLVLNALTGRGVHLVTVNDYLARWHASLMGPIYHMLGLSVSSIQHQQSFMYDPTYAPEDEEVKRLESETQGFVLDVKHMRTVSRREAYAADITYGTNNEFGFDYLRDNMVGDLSQMTQREMHYSIVDEVDSILIDEARTPLIISAPDTDPTDKYYRFAELVEKLEHGPDYSIDEKKKGVALSEVGIEKLEKLLNVKNIYEEEGVSTVHHLEQALRAKALFKLDRDYVVRDGEVILVDEFTGRLMFGRRYSDGLHQAIEAKEGVKIQQESKTLATVTFQNYFRMYKKLAGMTGTALTEAEEFFSIYKLEVVAIPTNKPMIREDRADAVYKSEKGKFEAITREVIERHKKGQPLLIGTVSIQKNELLAEHLRVAGLQFEILNAKNHEREAHIISQAGRYGAITVATNIAGRGVDILLGGNPIDPEEAEKVKQAGGLHILGTERHESRRIDNQLRGRAGRQGDPGSSQFFVSLEDDLMRLFGGDRLQKLMTTLGIEEDQPIEAGLVSKSIEQAQKKIEGLNFDTRKHVLEYDDVMNRQREIIYGKRRAWLQKEANHKEEIQGLIEAEISDLVRNHFLAENDIQELLNSLNSIFPVGNTEAGKIVELAKQPGDSEFAITDYAVSLAKQRYEEKEKALPDPNIMRQIERGISLQSLDNLWMEHLDTMEHLRDSVGLRGYGQRDPLVEYKRESFDLFKRLVAQINSQIVYTIYKVSLQQQPVSELQELAKNAQEISSESTAADTIEKIGRNDPCPCGSGKKYKKCHGK